GRGGAGERALGMFGHSHAVVCLKGVDLLFGVVTEDGQAFARAHRGIFVNVREQEEASWHPAVLLGTSEFAARSERALLDVPCRCPVSREVLKLFHLRSRSGFGGRFLRNNESAADKADHNASDNTLHMHLLGDAPDASYRVVDLS